MSDQYTMRDPTKQHPTPDCETQQQPGPGLAKEMDPKPDHGEVTYRATAGSRAARPWSPAPTAVSDERSPSPMPASALAQPVAERGIGGNVVAPGPVWTP